MAYGTRRFSVTFTRALQYPYPEPNSSYWYIFLRSFIILSSHLRLGLLKSLFPVGVPVKVLKALLPSSILATWHAHLNHLDLPWLYYVNGTNYEVSHRGAFSTSHSHPSWAQIFASGSCFRNTFSLHSPLNVRDHASQPSSTTDNIIVLYILIFKFYCLAAIISYRSLVDRCGSLGSRKPQI